MTLEGLLASAKQVIGEEGWTGVHDGTIEAAVKASYPKFAKGYQDAFMEFLVSALFREGYGGHLNPRQCAIAYSANEGERSLGGRYKGCEAANPVDARYAKIINESKNPGFATGVSCEHLKSLPASSRQRRSGWPQKASSQLRKLRHQRR